MLERHEIRRDEAQTIADAGYDIGTAAQRLEDKLIALTERKRFQRRFLMTPKTSASGVPALNKARADIERMLDAKVFLELWVKVKEGWRNNQYQMRNFGYEDQ